MDKGHEYIKQAELAELLRCTVAAIRNYRKEGRFHFVKIGGRYLIPAEEVSYIRKNGLRPVSAEYRKVARAVQRIQREKRRAANPLTPEGERRSRLIKAGIKKARGRKSAKSSTVAPSTP